MSQQTAPAATEPVAPAEATAAAAAAAAAPAESPSPAAPEKADEAPQGSGDSERSGAEDASVGPAPQAASSSPAPAAAAGPRLEGVERDSRLAEAQSLYEQAQQYIDQGEWTQAADLLSTVLEIRTAAYGEMDPRLIESYLKYGKSLLQAAKASSGDLSSVLSRERLKSKARTGEADGDEEDEEDNDEDDAETLEAAWEALEVARVIAERQSHGEPSKAEAVRLSDVYIDLGEVQLEAGREEQAIEDLSRCLAIREAHLEPSDRRMAEIHYSLGLALTGAEARAHLEKASASLRARMEQVGEASPEGVELKGLIDDIEGRKSEVQEDAMLEAAKSFIKQAFSSAQPAIGAAAPGSAAPAAAAAAAAPANVIDYGVLGGSRKTTRKSTESEAHNQKDGACPAAAAAAAPEAEVAGSGERKRTHDQVAESKDCEAPQAKKPCHE
eukprot:m51a1_g621 putative nuclear autoantigenic sperm protein (442) ;mRNA; r:119061-120580